MSHYASLQVVVPEAFILGSGELHVDMGSALNLVCIIEKVIFLSIYPENGWRIDFFCIIDRAQRHLSMSTGSETVTWSITMTRDEMFLLKQRPDRELKAV